MDGQTDGRADRQTSETWQPRLTLYSVTQTLLLGDWLWLYRAVMGGSSQSQGTGAGQKGRLTYHYRSYQSGSPARERE